VQSMLVDVLRDDGLATVEAPPTGAAAQPLDVRGTVTDINLAGRLEGVGSAFAQGHMSGIPVNVHL
jgi:hypothetical protein